jgi:hypothetical protein
MAVTNFNTSNQTFRKLMGNGLVYRVPQFQRDYSWEEEQWDDLWQDILAMLETGGESAHYLGYLVLQTDDDRNFDIIDGQQRLTTLSLLVLAVLQRLTQLAQQGHESDNNLRRADELRKTYIGYLDPVTLVARSKLTLNRNNDRLYQTYLVPLESAPRRGLKASEHLLRKAFDWFCDRVRQARSAPDGAALAQLIDTVADKLFFTVITVTDELNAFKVFETLNARGVRLSSTDLLKNYLFSVVHTEGSHPDELRALDDQWEALTGKIGSDSLPDFLRVHWNSRHAFTRHADLFKTIRGQVRQKAHVFQLVRYLDRDADIYAALGQPADELWTADQRAAIAELDLFGIRQPFSLLLAAYHTLNSDDFTRLLRACAVISFRYNVIGGLSPNEQERAYNAAAEGLAESRLTRFPDLLRALRSIYPSDEQFRAAFREKQLRTTTARNRRIARYILFKVERQLTGHEWDFNSDRYTLEHILPEHPTEAWTSFSDDDVDRFVYRLGNFTLLPATRNRDIGNAVYSDKLPLYTTSEFELTRRVAEENREWTPERIAARQNWLANQATGIWRIAELA